MHRKTAHRMLYNTSLFNALKRCPVQSGRPSLSLRKVHNVYNSWFNGGVDCGVGSSEAPYLVVSVLVLYSS